jgi:hypothetical protein
MVNLDDEIQNSIGDERFYKNIWDEFYHIFWTGVTSVALFYFTAQASFWISNAYLSVGYAAIYTVLAVIRIVVLRRKIRKHQAE